MKINRRLIAAIAVAALVIAGGTAWQLSGNESAQEATQPAITASPTPPDSEEISLESEEPSVVLTASTKKIFNSGDRSLTWDLGEFAKMMDSQ